LLRLVLLVAGCLSLCVLGVGLRLVLSIFGLGLRLLTWLLLLSFLSQALILVLLLLLTLVLVLVERVVVVTLLLLVLALTGRLRSPRFVSLLRVLKEFNSRSEDTNSQYNLPAEMEKTWWCMLVFTSLNEQ
jgi:hypothetical protein